MDQGTWVLVVAVAVALAFGLWRALTDGGFRGTHRVRGAESVADVPPPEDRLALPPDVVLGERATLLQFSSAFCAPCRAARRVLADVAGVVPGVAHVEIDAESHLDLVRQVGILRTPTTIVLDGRGREVARAGGVPRKEQVIAALARTEEES